MVRAAVLHRQVLAVRGRRAREGSRSSSSVHALARARTSPASTSPTRRRSRRPPRSASAGRGTPAGRARRRRGQARGQPAATASADGPPLLDDLATAGRRAGRCRRRDRSSTTCSAMTRRPNTSHRREPGPGRRGDRARDDRRGLPRLQREPRPAVRAQRSTCGCCAENASAVGRRAPRCARAASGSGSCETMRTRALPRRQGGRRDPGGARGAATTTCPVDTHVHDPPALAAGPEVPGDGARLLDRDGAGQDHVFPVEQTTVPVQIDDFARIFDARDAARDPAQPPGLRQRARRARHVPEPRRSRSCRALLGHLAPVARNLPTAAPGSAASSRELGDAARVVAPLAEDAVGLLHPGRRSPSRRSRATPEALKADDRALAPGAPGRHRVVARCSGPFLTDSAALAREMQPVARDLRPALPELNERARDAASRSRAARSRFYDDLQPRAGVAARPDARTRPRASRCAG